MARVSFRVISLRTAIVAVIFAVMAAAVLGVVVYGLLQIRHEQTPGSGAALTMPGATPTSTKGAPSDAGSATSTPGPTAAPTTAPSPTAMAGPSSDGSELIGEPSLLARLSALFWQRVRYGRNAIGMLSTGDVLPVTALPLHQPAPQFTLTDTAGQAVDLTAFQGRPVMLVFWASWCPDCPAQMGALADVHDHFRSGGAANSGATMEAEGRRDTGLEADSRRDTGLEADSRRDAGPEAGVAIIGINLMEDIATVRDFAEQHPVPFPLLLDADAAVSDAYFVRITPTIVLIDKDGIVRDRLFGLVDRDALIARVQGLTR